MDMYYLFTKNNEMYISRTDTNIGIYYIDTDLSNDPLIDTCIKKIKSGIGKLEDLISLYTTPKTSAEFYHLGLFNQLCKNYGQMKYYYGIVSALKHIGEKCNNLYTHYSTNNVKNKKIKKYLKMGHMIGNLRSTVYLGEHYKQTNKIPKALYYYNRALGNGYIDANYFLGQLYIHNETLKNIKRGIKYLKDGCGANSINCIAALSDYYSDNNNEKLSRKYQKMLINMKYCDLACNLSYYYITQNKVSKAVNILFMELKYCCKAETSRILRYFMKLNLSTEMTHKLLKKLCKEEYYIFNFFSTIEKIVNNSYDIFIYTKYRSYVYPQNMNFIKDIYKVKKNSSEHIECPICFESYKYIATLKCHKSHIICSDCYHLLNKCPLCSFF